MDKKKKWTLLSAAAFASGLIAASGVTAAYLSHTPGELVNVITMGDVRIRLKEENWKPEENRPLHPREAVSKDPAVENTGDQDAWVFLETDIPMETFSLVDETGKKKQEKRRQEIFSFQADEENWQLLRKEETEGAMRYVYGFRRLLGPGETTEPLFREAWAASFLEGDLDIKKEFTIAVNARAIQDHLEAEGLDEIYQEFLRQAEADRKGGYA